MPQDFHEPTFMSPAYIKIYFAISSLWVDKLYAIKLEQTLATN